VLEEGAQEGESGVFGGFVAMFGGGWLGGIRGGPATGRETTPAKTAKPFESSFRISKLPRL
jgi:hypothetical protein